MTPDSIPLGALGIGSGWALVCIFVILFMRGRIVPRQTMDDQRADYQRALDDLIHDRDEWRAAHRISEQARLEEREHNQVLTNDIAATLKSFLQGFRQAAARSRNEVDQ